MSAQPGDPGPNGGRSRLIAATVALVADQGLSKLTYRSLGARAGLSHASVRYHFGTLEAVLEAALERCLEITLEPLHLSSTPVDFVDNLREVVAEDPAVTTFIYEVVLESKRRPELRPHVRRLYATYWEATRRSLEAMGLRADPALVRAVFATAEGISFQAVALGQDDPDGASAALAGLPRLLDAAERLD